MYYATMVMHRPEQLPPQFKDILIMEKGDSIFNVGNYHNRGFYCKHDGREILEVEMWCEIPTRETIHKVTSL